MTSLGNDYDPLGVQDPYLLYARARREEPIFWSPTFDAWVVTRYEHVREVLGNPKVYSSRSVLPRIYPPSAAVVAELAKGHPPVATIISLDGAAHERVRKALLPVFSAARIRALEPSVRQHAEELLDAVAGTGRVELMAGYAEVLPLRVVCQLCGVDDPDHQAVFRAGFNAILELFSMPPRGEHEEVASARRLVAAQHLATDYARARRADPAEDLASQLAAELAPGGGPLTTEQEVEVSENLFEVVIAGQITTGPLIGSTVRFLLEDPERWRRVCAKPELIGAAVEETLRFDSPVSGLYRETTQEVVLGGVHLPEGARLALRFNSANRDDPAVTGHPEEFDLARTPGKQLSFGFGAHYCVGAELARLEARVALEVLTSRLPGLRLDGSVPVRVRAVHDLRGPDLLHVVW